MCPPANFISAFIYFTLNHAPSAKDQHTLEEILQCKTNELVRNRDNTESRIKDFLQQSIIPSGDKILHTLKITEYKKIHSRNNIMINKKKRQEQKKLISD